MLTLSNGVTLPELGFGTYKTDKENHAPIITEALKAGYRMLDTAAYYNNEAMVAQAIENAGLRREDVCIATKLWRADMGYESTLRACRESLARLQTEYADLYLIHWPRMSAEDADWRARGRETWRAMEKLYADGLVRAIGVSNHLPLHILNLLQTARVKPMVSQMEFHPGYVQWPAVEFCREQGILPQAYRPLGRGTILEHPIVAELARAYGKTPAQVCVRFALQCGVQPMVKASSRERMLENKDVFDFELSREDMYRLLCMPPAGFSGEHPDMH